MPSSDVSFPPDDVLREILLRLPPQPTCLLRASCVSKHWRAVTADPYFLRLHRARHGGDGAAPILGVLHNNPRAGGRFIGVGDPSVRVSAKRFSPPDLCCERWLVLRRGRWLVLGCHRGRAVLHDGASRLLVWDPVTDERRFVELPPLIHGFYHGLNAVLIVDEDDDDENRFRFRIAVASLVGGIVVGVIYSSEMGAWGDQAVALAWTSLTSEKPGVAIGDAVYWLLNDSRVLVLKQFAGGLHVLSGLPVKVPASYTDNVQLTRTPDGKIGLVAICGSTLHLLALETHGNTSWVLRRTVLLDEGISAGGGGVDGVGRNCIRIVGVHDDGAVVFLWAVSGLFMVRLELESTTHTIEKLHGTDKMHGQFYAVYPFASSFTPR